MNNRSVRRVPLEFDWPIGEKWEGFLNPHNKHFIVCEHCQGLAISKEARELEKIWLGSRPPQYDPKTGILDFGQIECEYGFVYHFTRRPHNQGGLFYLTMQQRSYNAYHADWIKSEGYQWQFAPTFETWRKDHSNDPVLFLKTHSAWMTMLDDDDAAALLQSGALRHLTHEWKGRWREKSPPHIPSTEEVNLYMHDEGLRDFTNGWIVIEAFCRRNHLAYVCPHCQGRGGRFPDEVTRVAAQNWKPAFPPIGPGYQFWEPSDQGAPLSPVFANPEGLVEWLVQQAIRLNRKVDVKKTLTWIQSNGTKGLSSTHFIWLYREYRICQKEVFHPTLLPDIAYQPSQTAK